MPTPEEHIAALGQLIVDLQGMTEREEHKYRVSKYETALRKQLAALEWAIEQLTPKPAFPHPRKC